MKTTAILVAACGLLVAATAAAQPDLGPDSVGLYFDDGPCYAVNGIQTDVIGTHTVHMVIAGPTANGARGFEITLAFVDPGTGFVLAAVYPVLAVDIDPSPEGFFVGFATAAPANECGMILIADVTIFVLDPAQEAEIIAGPYLVPSIPGVPAYLDGEDVAHVIPLHFATDPDGIGADENGWLLPGYGLCSVNGEAAVAAEAATWSDVKGLFR